MIDVFKDCNLSRNELLEIKRRIITNLEYECLMSLRGFYYNLLKCVNEQLSILELSQLKQMDGA